MSNLNQFFFARFKRFSPNLSIIGFVVRELHWLEVEGVVVEFMEIQPLDFCFI
jgi:hypothetical protein